MSSVIQNEFLLMAIEFVLKNNIMTHCVLLVSFKWRTVYVKRPLDFPMCFLPSEKTQTID